MPFRRHNIVFLEVENSVNIRLSQVRLQVQLPTTVVLQIEVFEPFERYLRFFGQLGGYFTGGYGPVAWMGGIMR